LATGFKTGVDQGEPTTVRGFFGPKNRLPLPRNYDQWDEKARKAARTRAIREEVQRIQDEYSVNYAGPLAGYHAGYREMKKVSMPVTEGPNLINPKPGKFPIIDRTFSQMFEATDRFQKGSPFLEILGTRPQ
jgi:hypothetical protein